MKLDNIIKYWKESHIVLRLVVFGVGLSVILITLFYFRAYANGIGDGVGDAVLPVQEVASHTHDNSHLHDVDQLTDGQDPPTDPSELVFCYTYYYECDRVLKKDGTYWMVDINGKWHPDQHLPNSLPIPSQNVAEWHGYMFFDKEGNQWRWIFDRWEIIGNR